MAAGPAAGFRPRLAAQAAGCRITPQKEKERITMMLTGSQIFVEVLAEQGVDTISGIRAARC